tara:strand:+ start:1617 stop:1880 length:264 start_codon:yes stop_codon:yes gene_type:complete
MSQYDNTGKVSLWSNETYEAGGKQPRLKGMAYAPYDMKAGEAMEVALWDNNSEHPKAPALTGKLDRKREAQAAPAMAATPVDDSIPF